MELSFTKMHGLGNDFVVIDAISQLVSLSTEQIRFLADRHRGIGCDQLLLVEAPQRDDVDFRYRIFNNDGGEVEQCGNGARCFARYVLDKGLTTKHEMAVETLRGVIRPRVETDGQVTVDMGIPDFTSDSLPIRENVESYNHEIDVSGEKVVFGAVSMGNPHAVIRVEDVESAPVLTLGPQMQASEIFPQGVNVGFMEVVGENNIKLRVFERSVGETQACGTGACAAVAVARLWGLVADSVAVDLPGGRLLIRWLGEGAPLMMTGPAETVFEGTIEFN